MTNDYGSVLEMWKKMDAQDNIKAYWTAHLSDGLKMNQNFRKAEVAEASERESGRRKEHVSSLTRRFRGGLVTGRFSGAGTAAPTDTESGAVSNTKQQFRPARASTARLGGLTELPVLQTQNQKKTRDHAPETELVISRPAPSLPPSAPSSTDRRHASEDVE